MAYDQKLVEMRSHIRGRPTKQESIPMGCISPTCQQFVLWLQDVSTGGGVGTQLNKFEQVPSDNHQMSVA